MKAAIYFPFFIVLRSGFKSAVYYLPTDLQLQKIFKKRVLPSRSAKRAGWQGFTYNLQRNRSKLESPDASICRLECFVSMGGRGIRFKRPTFGGVFRWKSSEVRGP
jgi:hypothetical protein